MERNSHHSDLKENRIRSENLPGSSLIIIIFFPLISDWFRSDHCKPVLLALGCPKLCVLAMEYGLCNSFCPAFLMTMGLEML